MCERTKEEILARELCIEYYRGLKSSKAINIGVKEYTESNWCNHLPQSRTLLSTLNTHISEKDKQ